MGCIVCATRGGAGSRANQERAIERAAAAGLPLVFLHVVDETAFGEVDDVVRNDVVAELKWVGSALLQLALQRALDAPIGAEIVMRHGRSVEEIQRFLVEADAEMLLVGAPRGTTVDNFGDDAVERFAATVTEATGVPVEIVRPEEGPAPAPELT